MPRTGTSFCVGDVQLLKLSALDVLFTSLLSFFVSGLKESSTSSLFGVSPSKDNGSTLTVSVTIFDSGFTSTLLLLSENACVRNCVTSRFGVFLTLASITSSTNFCSGLGGAQDSCLGIISVFLAITSNTLHSSSSKFAGCVKLVSELISALIISCGRCIFCSRYFGTISASSTSFLALVSLLEFTVSILSFL